jgi:hypothetical protein
LEEGGIGFRTLHQCLLFDRIADMPFEDRILNFNDEFIWDMYEQAEPQVIAKIKTFDESH